MWYGVVFIKKNAKKKTKKMQHFWKSFTSYLHNGSTLEQLILKATVQGYNFRFLTILGNWSCDHPPNNPLHGPWHASSFLSWLLLLFGQGCNDIFFFVYIQWTLKAVTDILYTIPIFFFHFCSDFLAIFSTMKYLLKASGIHMKSTMKYPGVKNEISIESARHLYEKRNEIFIEIT